MGLFDWIGPTSLTKRRGWDALPSAPTERKSSWTIDDYRAVVVSPLVHGPGLSDRPAADGNSAVYACLQAIATALAEPELRLYRVQAGERVEIEDAPIVDLLRRPNPHMTLDMLLQYVSRCLDVDGNAYWRKLRAGNDLTGNVVQLWPISPTRIEVKTHKGSDDYISYYRYYVRPGVYEDIDPSNIVHFRDGLDDRDHRLGCSRLKHLIREISSDEHATRYADRLLSNFATPGLSVVFPDGADPLTQAQADEIKAKIQAQYGGNNVGAVSVMSPGAKLETHGFSPEQMDLKVLHRVPEERIAAVLGIPAIVAGLGAGLDRSTYANFKEAREAFTEMRLIPSWRSVAATITLSLLPDFTSERGVSVEFDTSEVRALSDDENAKAERLVKLVAGGILTADEARAEIGREPLPERPAPLDLPSPESRSRPTLIRSLPYARKTLEENERLIRLLQEMHKDLIPEWIEAAVKGLEATQRRIRESLAAGVDTADALVPEAYAEVLGARLAPLQRDLIYRVNGLTVAELGVQFDLDDPLTREYLREAGTRIDGINDTTRDAVRRMLSEGQALGESIDELAARLMQMPAFGEARARVIARTELGQSQIEAAYANYRASGVVVGIRIFDGDYDADCAARNGRTLTLVQAAGAPRLLHPNCTAAWAPITDAAELERSA